MTGMYCRVFFKSSISIAWEPAFHTMILQYDVT